MYSSVRDARCSVILFSFVVCVIIIQSLDRLGDKVVADQPVRCLDCHLDRDVVFDTHAFVPRSAARFHDAHRDREFFDCCYFSVNVHLASIRRYVNYYTILGWRMAGRASASPPSRRGPGAFALVGRRSIRSRSSSIHSAQPSCTRRMRYPQPHAFSVRAFLLRPSFCPFVAGLRRLLYSLEFMRAFCLNLEAGSPGALSRLFIYWGAFPRGRPGKIIIQSRVSTSGSYLGRRAFPRNTRILRTRRDSRTAPISPVHLDSAVRAFPASTRCTS